MAKRLSTSHKPRHTLLAGLLGALLTHAYAAPAVDPATAQNVRVVQDVGGLRAFETAVASNPEQVAVGSSLTCPQPNTFSDPTVEATLPELRVELGEAVDNLAIANQQGFTEALNSGPGPYQRDFGGAQRDWIAGRLGEVKTVLNLYILYRNDFKLSQQGLFVLCGGQVGVNALVDWARFWGQELLKAHLINKRGMSRNSAAWASFAVAQTVSLITTPLATYGLSYALSGHFAQENNQRRRLMTAANEALDHIERLERFLAYMYTPEGMAAIYAQGGWSHWHSLNEQAYDDKYYYNSEYTRNLNQFKLHDDSPFTSGTEPAASGSRRLLDSYPATNYLTGTPNMQLMWSAMYRGYISRCRGSTVGSNISVTCPVMRAGSTSRLTLTFNPLRRNADGMVEVDMVRRNGNNQVTGTSRFFLDPAKLPPV